MVLEQDSNSILDLPTGADMDVAYLGLARSQTLRRISREVYGEDYPEDADPSSFVTKTDLGNIAGFLQLKRGQRLIDLACGRGGPGLWVARETGAKLFSLDFSRVAVRQAGARKAAFGLNGRAHFLVGDFMSVGIPSASLDGAMSVDALWGAPDKGAVLAEVFRILRPLARFVFTNWESDLSPPGWLPPVKDHRVLLRDAGFEVEAHEETADWERRQRAIYEGILANQEALIEEAGEDAASNLIGEAKVVPDKLSQSRRVLVAARKC